MGVRLKDALPKEITIEKPWEADVGHTGEEKKCRTLLANDLPGLKSRRRAM
jgi:hypothetical protein